MKQVGFFIIFFLNAHKNFSETRIKSKEEKVLFFTPVC